MTLHEVALAVGAGVVLLAACGTAGAPDPTGAAPAEAATWTRLADSPLSAREGPVVAHVRVDGTDSVVLVGGHTGPPCPPGADCSVPEGSVASDGAVLDVGRGTWRPIADAPEPVSAYAPTAVLGDTVYVLTPEHVLAWEADSDTWTRLDRPATPEYAGLVADRFAAGPRLVLVSQSDEYGARPDQVYDPADGTWSRLPPDPLRPSFDRVLTPTPHGLVLTARPIGPDGGPEDPALVRAAVLADGSSAWRPVSSGGDQLGGWHWTWTGTRMVDATPGSADGGEVNGYGRAIPYGGALDPRSGEWDALEDAPPESSGGWLVEAAGERYTAAQGWVYDDADAGRGSSWTRLARPPGAPAEPGRAVWVDGVLVVVGGADWDEPAPAVTAAPDDVWSSGVWAYRPGGPPAAEGDPG